jgi:hypothetical protein
MMKTKILFLMGCFIIFLSTFTFQECLAGVVVEQVVRDREGNPAKVFLHFSDYRFRTDHPEGGLTTIMDFKEDRLVMIEHRSKSYVEVKLSQWERETAKQLKEQLKGLKPKERKVIVKRTGRTAVINGFQTEEIGIWEEGELIEANWMTRDVEMKEIDQVMDRVAQGFSKDFSREMKEGREIYEKLKPYGFPILIKDYTTTYGLGTIDRLEVKKIEKKELKEDLFLPPADYQKIIPKTSKK